MCSLHTGSSISPCVEMQSGALWDMLPVVYDVAGRNVRMPEGHGGAPSPELLHNAPNVGDACQIGELWEAIADLCFYKPTLANIFGRYRIRDQAYRSQPGPSAEHPGTAASPRGTTRWRSDSGGLLPSQEPCSSNGERPYRVRSAYNKLKCQVRCLFFGVKAATIGCSNN